MREPKLYLKLLNKDRQTPYAIKYIPVMQPTWNGGTEEKLLPRPIQLPQRRWLEPQVPNPCVTGYHFVRNMHELGAWMRSRGEELWVVKVRGERNDGPDKGCAAEMILVRKLDIPINENVRFMYGWRAVGGQWQWPTGKVHANGPYMTAIDLTTPNWYTARNLAALAWAKSHYGPKKIERTMFYKYMQPILTAQGLETWGDN